jgi:hypothetical protein
MKNSEFNYMYVALGYTCQSIPKVLESLDHYSYAQKKTNRDV